MSRIALAFLLLIGWAHVAAAQPVSPAAELKKERAHRRSVRSAGHLLIGGAVALGAVGGAAVALGARTRDSIAFGGLATAEDIENRAEVARRYDLAARYLAVAGVALAATGFALVLTHPDPRRPRIEAAPVSGGAVVSLSGVLP